MKILPGGKSCPGRRKREGTQKNGNSFTMEAAPSVTTSDFIVKAFESTSTLKEVKREAAAQRRPAQSERKDRVFSAKRQTVWFRGC